MKTYERRLLVALAVVAVVAQTLGWAHTAWATTPPCQVFGHLEAAPEHVTAVFTVAETCAEVSLLSWLAPDAHAGQPQTLYDRHSESDVAPGDYRWTITAPPEGCFVQDDLALPGGYTIDFILGGSRLCGTPTTTITTTSTTTTTEAATTPTTTTTIASVSLATTTTQATNSTPTTTPPVSSEELAFSGGGELWALTLGALGLIGAGRWFEHRAKKRRA